jgi:pimeloyl-ACP methyl ester carboxylesterase
MHAGAAAPPVTTLPMPHVDGVEHTYRVVGGVRVHCAEAGAGEPLVLLHGWPQHWWSWRELIGPLAEHYRVICPDIRGMGWSDAPRTGYDLKTLTNDLFGLLDALGIDRVKLVGHDWGALIGYIAATFSPHRVERFVPMGVVHLWSADGLSLRLLARPWHVYLLATPAGRPLVPPVARRCLHEWRKQGRFTTEETAIYTAPLARPLSRNATTQRDRQIALHDIPHFALHYRSARLEVPTLHLNGERDPLTRHVPDTYARYAPEMRLELVPGAGHFVAEENPGWVLDRLLGFLRP